VHSTWTFDGQEVLYHCPPSPSDPRGYVIGVNDLEGNNVAEYRSAYWTHYGHVGAVPGRKAIVLDGNLTDDLIVWLYYDDPSQPRIEVICRHGTNWGGHEGQYSHPHPQCAPTGERIVYNSAYKGHSDVFIVEV
jgi:Tol biopolymer transport system component